jgi:hypothetical protein
MILPQDLKDETENLSVLYSEQPSPAAFGDPPAGRTSPAPARPPRFDAKLTLNAARALAVTWRDWFRDRRR